MTTLTLSMHYKASAAVCVPGGTGLIFGVTADTRSVSKGGTLQGYDLVIKPKAEMGAKDRLVLLMTHASGDKEYVVYNHELQEIGRFPEWDVIKRFKTKDRKYVEVFSGGRQGVSILLKEHCSWGGIDAETLVHGRGGALDGTDYIYLLPQDMREADVLVLRFPSNHDAVIKTYNYNGELVAEKYEWELMLERAFSGRPHLDLSFGWRIRADLTDLDEYQLPIKCVAAERIDWACWRGNNDNWKFSVVTAEPAKIGDHVAVHSWLNAGDGFDVITYYRFDGREFVEVQEDRVEDLRKQSEASKLVASGEAERQLQELEDELDAMTRELKSKRRELQGQPGWKLTQLENLYGDQMADIRRKIYDLETALGY